VQEALVLVYGDILDFCQKALKLYVDEEGNRRSGLKVFGKSLIERFSDTFGEIVDNFDAHLENYKGRAEHCDSRRLMQIFSVVVNSALQLREGNKQVMDTILAGNNQLLQVRQGQLSASQEQRDAQRAYRQAHEEIMDSLLAGKSQAQAQEDQRVAELRRAREEKERVERGS
jgi:hypothetical protein